MIIDTEFRAIRDRINQIVTRENVLNGQTMYGMEKEVSKMLDEFNIDFTEKDFFIKWGLELYITHCYCSQTVPKLGSAV